MNVIVRTVRGVGQAVGKTAEVAAATAGAISGAAISGVVGAITGTVNGVRQGVASGSHSTPAAVLTLGVVGAAGLVEWPILLAVGGGALLLRKLSETEMPSETAAKPAVSALKLVQGGPAATKSTRAAQPAKKATKTAAKSATKPATKASAGSATRTSGGSAATKSVPPRKAAARKPAPRQPRRST